MRKKLLFLLLCLALPCLAACGERAERLPAPESSAAPAEEPMPSTPPAPAPTPEILTEILLRDDPLPEGYRMLDYAACSNSTLDAQTYVDTGISPTNNTRFYLDFECTSGFSVKDTWFFGCFDRDHYMFMEAGFHQSQGNDANFYTATGVHYSQTENSSLRTVAWLRPGDYVCPDVRNGRMLYSFDEPCAQHLFLFSRQHMDRTIAGTHDIEGHYDLRIYACRIWQEGEPVRDYVPCLRLEDGRFGMFDLVEGLACFSDGTEELQGGEPVLPDRSLSARGGKIRGSIAPPEAEGFVFQGYYTEPGGGGERILDESGLPCADVAQEEQVTLYAFWTRDEAWFDRY